MYRELTVSLIKFNKEQLLSHFYALLVHPFNRQFILHFEILIEVVLSIDNSKFGNTDVNTKDIEKIIRCIEKELGSYFSTMEDITPPNNLKATPYYFNGERYFYLYAAIERPHEFLKHFEELFIPFDSSFQDNYGYSASEVFELLMKFNTAIVNALISYLGDPNKYDKTGEKLYLGDRKYFIFWNKFFNAQVKIFSEEVNALKTVVKNLLVADDGKIVVTNLKKESYPIGISEYLGYKIGDKYIPIVPTGTIFFLFKHFIKLFLQLKKEDPQIEINLERYAVFRIYKSLRNITQSLVARGVVAVDEKGNQSQVVDISLFEDGKLIIINLINRFPDDKDFDKKSKNVLSELEQFIDFIKENKKIRLIAANAKTEIDDTSNIEVIPIMIVNNMSIEDSFGMGAFKRKITSWVGILIDFEALCEELDSPLEIIKFIREENDLYKNCRVVAVDYADLIALYTPSKSFGNFQNINVFVATPHSWSDHIHQKLLKDKVNDINFEGDYNWVSEEYYPKSFRLTKKNRSGAAYVSRLSRYDIWIMFFSEEIPLKGEDEFKLTDFLSHLVSFHLSKNTLLVDKFFKALGLKVEKRIVIAVYPDDLIIRTEKLKHHQPLVDILKINDIAIAGKAGYTEPMGTLSVSLVFNIDNLRKLFIGNGVISEKFVLKTILEAFKELSKKEISVDEIINIMFPKNYKGSFTLNAYSTPYSGFKVHKPSVVDRSSVERINKQINAFLLKSGINPGRYQDSKAVEINIKIYEFLISLLSTELIKYKFDDLLLHSLKKLEQIETFRTYEGWRLKRESQLDIVYDPIKAKVDLDLQSGQQLTALRFLIENLVKLGDSGNKEILDQEKWDSILALVAVIGDTIALIERIKHQVLPIALDIDHSYRIKDIPIDIDSDEKGYGYRAAIAKDYLESASQKSDLPQEDDYDHALKAINEAFIEEFGVTFEQAIEFLAIASAYTADHKEDVSVINIEGFKKWSKDNLKSLNEKSLDVALNSFSISKKSLLLETHGPWDLRHRRNRIGFKPVIVVGNILYLAHFVIFDSLALLTEYVMSGRLPVDPITENLKAALGSRLDKLANAFEAEVYQKSKKKYELSLPKVKKLVDVSIIDDPGEIDTLTIIPEKKLILVIDAKDIRKGITPYEIKRETVNLFRHIEKLKNKISFINDNKELISMHFKNVFGKNKTVPPLENFEVKGFFVTKSIHFSTYLDEEGIRFLYFGDLEEFLEKIK